DRRDAGRRRGHENGERAARRARLRGEANSCQARRQFGCRCGDHGIRLSLVSRSGVMSFLSFPLSPFGRVSPRAFAIAIALVYLAAFASQMLLAAPVTSRAGLMPFALAQFILLWVWFALHAKRLHDSERSAGWAVAVGLIYALGVILLVLLVE